MIIIRKMVIYSPSSAPANYEKLYDSDTGTKLTITGILRPKKDGSSSSLTPGIAYTTNLTAAVVEDAQKSEIATAQKNSDKECSDFYLLFKTILRRRTRLRMLGADITPTGINIYPKDYASKDQIKKYLDEYNNGKADKDLDLIYTDIARNSIYFVAGKLLDTVTYVSDRICCYFSLGFYDYDWYHNICLSH